MPAVIVDGYSTGMFLPPAFARLGVEVVHVQSTPRLMRAMAPPDLSAYRANVIHHDLERTVAELAAHAPVAVLAGSEAGVELADALGERLGLAANSTGLSAARRDKYLMIETIRAAGLRCARQFAAEDPGEIVAWADREGYPVVVKPHSSACTENVTICHDPGETLRAANAVLAATNMFDQRNHSVLVQSYLPGTEYIVDTVGAGGAPHICGVWEYEKITTPAGRRVYDRDVLLDPAAPPVPDLVAYATAVLGVLGIRYGAAHTELIATPDGPALVEVAARLNGNLDPDFHIACIGADQAGLTALAYARPEEFESAYAGRTYRKLTHAVVHNTSTTQDGVVESIDEHAVAQIAELPTVHRLSVRLGPGRRIRPTADLLTSPLRVFMADDDAGQLAADHKTIGDLKDLVYRVTPPPRLLLAGGARPISTSVDIASLALSQARSRGFVTHVTNTADTLAATWRVNELADEVSAIDPERPEECERWARDRVAAGERFDLVLGLRDTVQIAAARTAQVLGAACNTPEVAGRVRAKDACRAALAAAGFPQPAVRLCRDVDQAAAFLRETRGPWVVKPRDAMGSIGVRLVRDAGELAGAVAELPDPSLFLVEEFVEGPEFSVEGVFLGGLPRVLAVTAKDKLPPPYFVEIGHVIPADLPDEVTREIKAQVSAALLALGVRFGVFCVEAWLSGGRVVLGEVHTRPGGDWLHTLLGYAIPGLELFGLIYDDVLGRPAPADLTPTRVAGAFFLAAGPGRLVAVRGWEEAAAHPSVLHAELSVAPGSVLVPVRDSGDRAGVIVVGADTADQVRELGRALVSAVEFDVD